jgi:leucyl/phenylalanyl-tRNA---protein transferase
MQAHTPLPWLDTGTTFPSVDKAWAADSPAPGLLAAGGVLDVPTLQAAYRAGIFPWYSQGQPILWWSPDPRMVLRVQEFKLHRSLRKTLHKFAMSPDCELRIDHDFAAVIHACAHTPRDASPVVHASQAPNTWIVPDMQAAYTALHAAGLAHSIETWVGGKLVGGLYCTAIGGAVFGESMFSTQSDASKIALCALVALCRAQVWASSTASKTPRTWHHWAHARCCALIFAPLCTATPSRARAHGALTRYTGTRFTLRTSNQPA